MTNDKIYEDKEWKELVLLLCRELELVHGSPALDILIEDARHYTENGNWNNFNPFKRYQDYKLGTGPK